MANKKFTPASILAHQRGKKRFSRASVEEAAHTMGKMGGDIGGPARAAKLPSKTLSKIAHHAACQRWGVPCNPGCEYC